MKEIINLARNKAEKAEVLVFRNRSTPVQFSRGELQKISKKDTVGVGLRLIKDGRLGFATSSSTEDTEIVDRALDAAQFGEEIDLTFPEQSEPEEAEAYDPYLASLTEEELIADSSEIMNKMAAFDPSIPLDLRVGQSELEVEITNSEGLDGKYSKTGFSTFVSTRSPQGFSEVRRAYSSSRYFSFPELWLSELTERHHQAQNRMQVPTGKMPVIFSPGTFGALILRLIVGINGSSINQGISPLEDKLGDKLFDTSLNIYEQPHRTWGLLSCPFDDEGVPTQSKAIVDEGVLKHFLYDLKSGKEAGKESTGNGFKRQLFGGGITALPSPAPTNLVIPGGTTPLAEMIAGIDEGILIEGVMGAHTGNIPAGEYSLNINPGFYIKNGRIVGKATDAMVSGNIYESLTKIGDFSSEQGLLAMFGPMGYAPYVMLPEASVTGKG